MFLAKHLEAAGGFEHRRPLDVVDGAVHKVRPWQQHEILDVKYPGGFVCPLDHHADACKVPGFAMAHGGVHQAGKKVAAHLDDLEKAVRIFYRHGRALIVGQFQVEIVQMLPHLRRNDLANGAAVFPCRRQAGQDGIWVFPVKRQKMAHFLLSVLRVFFFEQLLVAGNHHQRLPVLALF